MRNSVTPPSSNKIFFNNPYLAGITSIKPKKNTAGELPQILFVTSYPPRECGIATYSQDLVKALTDKFDGSFKIKICALENDIEHYEYPKEVKYVLNTQHRDNYTSLANIINLDDKVELVVLQHEFGFFHDNKEAFIDFLKSVEKSKSIVFHTVLPNANETFKEHVNEIISHTDSIIVMTEKSAAIL
ncbi:MAG: mannosyltransferase, partial [Flavobacterium sp.]